MTQYTLKLGLKDFFDIGDGEVKKELMELHMLRTFNPVKVDKLIMEQKK